LATRAAGIAVLLALWWVGGWLIANNEDTVELRRLRAGAGLRALGDLLGSGEVWGDGPPSLSASAWVCSGRSSSACRSVSPSACSSMLREISHVPFQFLRMISPLAWMPIAVLAFATWDGAIVFLIAVAAVWPILFSTAQGVRRIDPLWFKVARNLGADGFQMLRRIILPAIGQDIFAGVRLAVGVAWIVLVPAEYLGVTSGLGYAINDARDTLEYDTLAAMVVIIGVIGFILDVQPTRNRPDGLPCPHRQDRP
jgi:NitT/TauT family transport system permease protein